MNKESFVFYRSFYESLKDLEDVDRLIMLDAILKYSLDGEVPELKGMHLALFTLIKPQIDANMKRYENGKKGGRPKAQQLSENEHIDCLLETEVKPNDNQTVTTGEPNVNVNVNVNENVNENENENVSLSLSLSTERTDREITTKEKERFIEILFFEKKIFCPGKEAERFINSYQSAGWKDGAGRQITDRSAKLRTWRPEDPSKVPKDFAARWGMFYRFIKEKYPTSNYMLYLTDLLAIEETKDFIRLHVTQELGESLNKLKNYPEGLQMLHDSLAKPIKVCKVNH